MHVIFKQIYNDGNVFTTTVGGLEYQLERITSGWQVRRNGYICGFGPTRIRALQDAEDVWFSDERAN